MLKKYSTSVSGPKGASDFSSSASEGKIARDDFYTTVACNEWGVDTTPGAYIRKHFQPAANPADDLLVKKIAGLLPASGQATRGLIFQGELSVWEPVSIDLTALIFGSEVVFEADKKPTLERFCPRGLVSDRSVPDKLLRVEVAADTTVPVAVLELKGTAASTDVAALQALAEAHNVACRLFELLPVRHMGRGMGFKVEASSPHAFSSLEERRCTGC